MKLSIRTSGGFGNIRIQGRLDTDELDPSLAARVQSTLSPQRLDSLPPPAGGPEVDTVQYEIDLDTEGGVRRYLLDEASIPREMQEVLQALVHEVIQKRRRNG